MPRSSTKHPLPPAPLRACGHPPRRAGGSGAELPAPARPLPAVGRRRNPPRRGPRRPRRASRRGLRPRPAPPGSLEGCSRARCLGKSVQVRLDPLRTCQRAAENLGTFGSEVTALLRVPAAFSTTWLLTANEGVACVGVLGRECLTASVFYRRGPSLRGGAGTRGSAAGSGNTGTHRPLKSCSRRCPVN